MQAKTEYPFDFAKSSGDNSTLEFSVSEIFDCGESISSNLESIFSEESFPQDITIRIITYFKNICYDLFSFIKKKLLLVRATAFLMPKPHSASKNT